MGKIFRIQRVNWIDIILHIIALVSLYIMTSYIFHDIKISYSFLTEAKTKLFNDVVYSLACGYVGSYITYMLTVEIQNYKERKRFIWQIYEIEQKLNEIWGKYLENFSKRFELMNEEDFCHDMIDGNLVNLDDNAEVSIKKNMYKAGSVCITAIESTYEKLRIYDAYLSEYEHNCIKYILDGSSFLKEDAINEECRTTYKTVKVLWYNAFIGCSQAMKALNNSIVREMGNRNNGKK